MGKVTIPEEIVLSDSEEEGESALKTMPESSSNNKSIGASKQQTSTVESQIQYKPTHVGNSDLESDSDQLCIDEADLQNANDNSSL